jgi:phosphopantothenoylcysteine decarboxylase/phosphopantothenate--cysteine ligase
MTGVAGRHVVLGVSGGIACYKSCVVARRLAEAGAQVDVVMTAAATEFVGPVTFEALTGRSVVTSLWDPDRALDHVRMGREADLIVVAPATAHLIARVAMGMADDFLTTLLLARRADVLLCPAMNDQMFRHQDTQANLARLKAQGVHVLGPVTGALARGEGEGPGRMVEPEEIVAWAERLLRSAAPFAGRHIVVTAGPTREAIDPVRVVTNRSSGRMGYALARSAWLRGADVTLITGPTALAAPVGPKVVRVESTAQLQDAVGTALALADVLLMAAAPSDYAPAQVSAVKHKRAAGPLHQRRDRRVRPGVRRPGKRREGEARREGARPGRRERRHRGGQRPRGGHQPRLARHEGPRGGAAADAEGRRGRGDPRPRRGDARGPWLTHASICACSWSSGRPT